MMATVRDTVEEHKPAVLPTSTAWLFPEYRFETMDAEQQPMPDMLTPVEWPEVRRYCEAAATRLVRRLLGR